MKFRISKNSALWCALLVMILLTCDRYSPAQDQNAKMKVPEPRQKDGSPPSTNLDVILEGPFAVCTDQKAQQVKILIPKIKHHFAPGFDSDISELPLCGGDYVLDVGRQTPGNGAPSITSQDPIYDIADTVQCNSVSKDFLSLVVINPDNFQIATSTQATVVGGKADTQHGYATRILLSYQNVDLTKVQVTGPACKFLTKPTPITVPLQFILSTTEGHLVFSMTPSRKDNNLHRDSKAAYKAVAKMLGLHRSVKFPTSEDNIGSHDDCRAPQILVTQ